MMTSLLLLLLLAVLILGQKPAPTLCNLVGTTSVSTTQAINCLPPSTGDAFKFELSVYSTKGDSFTVFYQIGTLQQQAICRTPNSCTVTFTCTPFPGNPQSNRDFCTHQWSSIVVTLKNDNTVSSASLVYSIVVRDITYNNALSIGTSAWAPGRKYSIPDKTLCGYFSPSFLEVRNEVSVYSPISFYGCGIVPNDITPDLTLGYGSQRMRLCASVTNGTRCSGDFAVSKVITMSANSAMKEIGIPPFLLIVLSLLLLSLV